MSDARGRCVRARGRVIGRRRVSKRLAFYDVRCDRVRALEDEGEDGDGEARAAAAREATTSSAFARDVDVAIEDGVVDDLEVVVKVGVGSFAAPECVATAQKTALKLGNVVEVAGTLTRRPPGSHGEWSLACERVVSVVESWAEANPGRAFAREAVEGARGDESPDATSRASGKDAGPCKFFINNGYCAKGDACKYAHDRAMQKNWIAERKANRRQLAVESGDPHGDSVASKHARAGKFTSWLVDKFGVDVLNSGTGVLDVAGGRGDVSFELHTKMGIKSTLVEPRARKLNKHQHKWLKAEAKRLKTDAPDTDSWLCEQIKTEFSSENWHLFKDCSVIVGMHPDQATEPIIDFAIEFKKPFAVVPCCVFPDLFKHRRDRQGKLVTQRASLVEYIADKTGGEVEYLDIEGANQVVFGTPTES